RKYVTIVSNEQRQSYSADFTTDYSEYEELHTWIDNTSKKFVMLEKQLKLTTPGSKECQVKKGETLK
ncbi:ELL factor, partial [Thinocorus orbignyianus]|nr:ELL factor [Thinocorus orbignyianus]